MKDERIMLESSYIIEDSIIFPEENMCLYIYKYVIDIQ